MSDKRATPLPPALDAERRGINGTAGRLSYYVAGEGPPMLLVHSINAAASAYEVKPIFERMTSSYRVYALDLPGFGFSDRSKRAYTPRLYTDAIHDMLDAIGKDGHGDTPVDALAISLGAEFLARAATEHAERFRTLTLVTPTGFQAGSERLRGGAERRAKFRASTASSTSASGARRSTISSSRKEASVTSCAGPSAPTTMTRHLWSTII